MGAYQFLNSLVGMIALGMLGAHVLQVAVTAVRRRRAGAPTAIVGADMTSQLIGLGLALSAAVSGGYVVFSALHPYGLEPVIHLTAQVLAAVVGSWLAGHSYVRWLAKPVSTWFAGEEGAGNDR
ncbi:MAG TPA: hypothetical protein VD969_04685 [Symbiobacteriaceae bacterium]|nr:hypothetical protein [Symbiobacteriaceae bacterium]